MEDYMKMKFPKYKHITFCNLFMKKWFHLFLSKDDLNRDFLC